MASLEMSGKLQLCIWRSRMARWKSGREEGTLRCTGLLPERDHAAEADSTYRKKNFTQDFQCSLIVRSECVPGTAGFLSAGLVNSVQKPHIWPHFFNLFYEIPLQPGPTMPYSWISNIPDHVWPYYWLQMDFSSLSSSSCNIKCFVLTFAFAFVRCFTHCFGMDWVWGQMISEVHGCGGTSAPPVRTEISSCRAGLRGSRLHPGAVGPRPLQTQGFEAHLFHSEWENGSDSSVRLCTYSLALAVTTTAAVKSGLLPSCH